MKQMEKKSKSMKRTYFSPKTNVVCQMSVRIMATSDTMTIHNEVGTGGQLSRKSNWDEEEE